MRTILKMTRASRLFPLKRPRGLRPARFAPIAGVLIATSLSLGSLTVAQAPAPQPIRILIDVHADPMTDLSGDCSIAATIDLVKQSGDYMDLVNTLDWILNEANLRGANISFLSTGEFMEWVQEPAGSILVTPAVLTNPGPDLLDRLYASGDQIGTHSHCKLRCDIHDWRNITMCLTPSDEQVMQSWENHRDAVNDAILLSFPAVSDPMTLNVSRGGGIPSDQARKRALMEDFGYLIWEQGEDQQFYDYFSHYVMNPWRPASDNLLAEDLLGPVVLAPTNSVLGVNGEHFGIFQNNAIEYQQARFLLELLNWLHDVHLVAGAERVWTFGWGSHPTDYMVGGDSRAPYPVMLDWLVDHFVGKSVGGQVAASFNSYVEAHQAYLDWETANTGASSFDYPSTSTDWDLYPYLKPVAHYLVDATYVTPMPPTASVRWHQVTAAAGVGGFDFYVAYTTDGIPVVEDLSPTLGLVQLAVIDTETGDVQLRWSDAIPVPPQGVLLTRPAEATPMCSSPADTEFPMLGSPCPGAVGVCAGGFMVCSADMLSAECSVQPVTEVCDGLDNDCSGTVDDNIAPLLSEAALAVDETLVVWAAMAEVSSYDVVLGDAGALRTSPLSSTVLGCPGYDLTDTSMVHTAAPAAGQILYYLVRGGNCGGDGPWGAAALSAQVNASSASCP